MFQIIRSYEDKMSGEAPFEAMVEEFVRALRRGKIHGSYPCASRTAMICRSVVANLRWSNAYLLIHFITKLGNKLIAAKPEEVVIGNVVRRVLFVIREEYSHLNMEKEVEEEKKPGNVPNVETRIQRRNTQKLLHNSGMYRFMELGEEAEETLLHAYTDLKSNILEGINFLIEELENSYENVSDQAFEHIHANEVIMTFGRSRTVEKFLKAAGRKRSFQLIVAEGAPSYLGRETAQELSKEGIDTTLIPDAAVYAMMARVNKVIVGTHAVMANGGLIAQAGIRLVAQAAKYHSVPLLVCTALYKLCPVHPSEKDLDLRSPIEILNFEEISGTMADVTVINPNWDYIPPELVSLFVTNSGGHNPTYIYRLLSEYYDPKDQDIIS